MIIYNTYPVDCANLTLLQYKCFLIHSDFTASVFPDAEFLMYNNTHQNNMLKTHIIIKKKRIGERKAE